MKSPAVSRRLIGALAPLAALQMLGVNVYLPALPMIGAFFAVEIQVIEASLSLFLLGAAAGQLMGAPLSDRYGRRPVALVGVTVFLVATLGILVCRSAEQFLVLRLLQAAGGGAAAVNTAAVVGDLFRTQQAARTLNAIGVFVLFAPLLGPILGALLLEVFSWQAVFVFLFLYAAGLWLVVWRWFPETVSRTGRPARSLVRQTLHGFVEVARRPRALAYALSLSCAVGAVLVFMTDAAFVFMDRMGISPRLFGILSGLNVIALLIGNRLNRLLLRRIPAHRIIPFGSSCQVLATLLLWLHLAWMPPSLAVMIPLVMCFAGALGVIAGNANANFLAWFPENRGAASGVSGCLPWLVGGFAGGVLGVVHDGTPATTGVAVLLVSSCGLFALIPARPAPAGESAGRDAAPAGVA